MRVCACVRAYVYESLNYFNRSRKQHKFNVVNEQRRKKKHKTIGGIQTIRQNHITFSVKQNSLGPHLTVTFST